MEIDVLDILISSMISSSALIAYIYYEHKKYRLDFLVQKFHEPEAH